MSKHAYDDTSLLSPAPLRSKIHSMLNEQVHPIHNLGPTGVAAKCNNLLGNNQSSNTINNNGGEAGNNKTIRELSARRLF
jgi:hypothetical protein